VAAFLVGGHDISASDEVGDIGIVVIGPILSNAILRSYGEPESSPLESELRIHPIPASRQRVLTPIRLMDKANIDESALEPEEIIIGVQHAHEFRFVIRLPKWRRFRFVIHLEE
jgi:hypothetical protein